MKKPHAAAYLLFTLAAMANLWFVYADNASGRFFTKPLLMPLLMLGYYLETKPLQFFSRLLLAGLFFSWLGDVFLMFDSRSEMFFMAGLLSFLTAHVFYIGYFSRIRSQKESFLRKRPVMLLAVMAYVVELMYVLWPHLGGMKLPVMVYGIVIGTMLCLALWQYGKIPANAAWLFIAGAIFFVASDSLLAINKFRSPIPLGGLWVMGTYVLAQYLIARGSAAQLKEVQGA
ncbi:MAG: lysoplasmalogenase [Chitinophagaceae bacterium]|jgi:uncharacterized membrane protein YhhN|nr:lysoplasmalogenase [Chitinophagaceae bacterium]